MDTSATQAMPTTIRARRVNAASATVSVTFDPLEMFLLSSESANSFVQAHQGLVGPDVRLENRRGRLTERRAIDFRHPHSPFLNGRLRARLDGIPQCAHVGNG